MSTNPAVTPSGVQVVDFEAALNSLTEAHLIKEEYRTWKKNAPLLYDTIINTTLEQVSLSVEWFADKTINTTDNYVAHRLLMGTQTSSDTPNAVVISEVRLPLDAKQNADGHPAPKLQNSGKIETIQRITHDGDVNRARYMPQNPNIIATKSSNKDLYIFDRTQHASKSTKNESSPQLRLIGHTDEGYGLSWDPQNAGKVVSGSADKKILMWDLQQSGVVSTTKAPLATTDAATTTTTTSETVGAPVEQTVSVTPSRTAIQPLVTLGGATGGHTDIVEDVCHHPTSADMLLSCGDDNLICVWDLRQPNEPIFKVKGHSAEVNSVSINSHDVNIFASASSDKTVGMWDLRNLTQKLHSFEHHTDQVFAVQWAPFAENILASASTDRRVMIWDVLQIGEEQEDDDTEDGPPELLFMHCGHTDKVNDIAWSFSQDWLMASCADNEVLQVWELAKAIRDEEGEDGDDEDDELSEDDLE